MDTVSKLVTQLAQASGAELAYKSDQNCIEVFGTERAVRNVYQMLYDMPFLKVGHATSTKPAKITSWANIFP
jgi:hypothetical protein